MTLLCFRLGFAEVYILLNKYYIVQLLALKKISAHLGFFPSWWKVSSRKTANLCPEGWGQAVNPIHDESHVLYFLFLFLIIAVHVLAFCYFPILGTVQTLDTSGSRLKTLFWSLTDGKFVGMNPDNWLVTSSSLPLRTSQATFPSVLFHHPLLWSQCKWSRQMGWTLATSWSVSITCCCVQVTQPWKQWPLSSTNTSSLQPRHPRASVLRIAWNGLLRPPPLAHPVHHLEGRAEGRMGTGR